MLILFFHTDLQMKPRCSYGGTKPFRWRSIKLSLVLPIGPYLAHWTTSSLVWWLKARIVAHLVYSAPLGSADSLISPTGMLQEGLSWWSHHKIDTYQFNINSMSIINPPPSVVLLIILPLAFSCVLSDSPYSRVSTWLLMLHLVTC